METSQLHEDPDRPKDSPVSRHPEEVRLWKEFADTRAPELRAELAERYLPLAKSLARRYQRAREPLDDLVQVASLGLMKAIDGFDVGRGRPFTSYAVPTILGELRRHFRDHVWLVRLPRSLQELTAKIDSATEDLSERLGRYPSVAELSEQLDVSPERVLEALEAAQARFLDSLDKPTVTDDDAAAPLIDRVGEQELGYDQVEAQASADDLELSDRERLVLRLRFEDGMTQQEIADIVGVSQMQISRISRAALWRVLCAVRGLPADSPPPRKRRAPATSADAG